MAKTIGINGPTSGKLGGQVYAVRNGEQIVRAYQPYVANPSTPVQVQNRARMKLLSQLSASIAEVIAIQRKGAISPRNLFVSANYKYTNANNAQADIALADVQLTNSAVALAGFSATRDASTGIAVALAEDMSKRVDRVVYVVLSKTNAGGVVAAANQVVTDAGQAGTFAASLPYVAGEIAVLAYGMKDTSGKATAIFGNLISPDAESIAKIITSRQVNYADVTLTETRGLYMAESAASGQTSGAVEGNHAVSLGFTTDSTYNQAQLSGAGSFPAGQSVTVQAGAGTFVGWYNNQDGAAAHLESTSKTYTFVMPSHAVTLFAKFSAAPSGGTGDGDGSDE